MVVSFFEEALMTTRKKTLSCSIKTQCSTSQVSLKLEALYCVHEEDTLSGLMWIFKRTVSMRRFFGYLFE